MVSKEKIIASIKHPLYQIIALGLLLRVLFLLVGAKLYFGRSDFFISGDTDWWVASIQNLIETGTYTIDASNPLAAFARTPGYSFFIGFFYLLSGKNMALAYPMIIWAQIILDLFSIYFIYSISKGVFSKYSSAPIIAALLYATYPFIIIWNVVAYAESLSVFLFLWFLYLYQKSDKPVAFARSGVVLALAVLTRIQLIVFIPIMILIHYFFRRKVANHILRETIALAMGIGLVYGMWPARNYINHGKLIFAQHLTDAWHWSPDYMRFMDYIWSVKTDHEPQMTQILTHQQVAFPPSAYVVDGDSARLVRFVQLARECGEGFSYFARSAGLRKDVVKRGEDCNDEIVALLDTLILHQKKFNAWSYYVGVPLGNLKKALFKFSLQKEINIAKMLIANGLFFIRTTLLMLAIAALVLMFLKEDTLWKQPLMLIVVGYFAGWYLFQSFYYRNMEIRFLIHADILMLLPAAWLIDRLFSKKQHKLAIA